MGEIMTTSTKTPTGPQTRPLTDDEKLFLKHGIDAAMCYFRSLKRYRGGSYFQEDEQKILDGLERAWEIAASIREGMVKADD